MAVGCGYLIVDSSITVGKSVTVVDKYVFTLPEGFSIGDSQTYNDAAIEHDGTPEKITIKLLDKNTTVKKEIKKFNSHFNESYKVIANNTTTKTPKGHTVHTFYYNNTTDNLSSSFVKRLDHTFLIETVGYNDIKDLNEDVYYVIDTLRPDYKQSQD